MEEGSFFKLLLLSSWIAVGVAKQAHQISHSNCHLYSYVSISDPSYSYVLISDYFNDLSVSSMGMWKTHLLLITKVL
jgi:hypothetical protein